MSQGYVTSAENQRDLLAIKPVFDLEGGRQRRGPSVFRQIVGLLQM